MPSLIDLPTETLTRIASYIDPSECHNLAITCRQLQYPAEAQIWADIQVQPYNEIDNDIDLVSGNEGSSEDEYGGRGKSFDPSSSLLETVDQPAEVLSAIERAPDREKMIKRLTLGLHEQTIDAQVDILHRTSRTLNSLDVDFADRHVGQRELTREFYHLLEAHSAGARYERVTLLSAPIGVDWNSEIGKIASFFPHVRSLSLRQICQSGESGDTLGEWNSLPNLQILRLELIDASARLFIIPLLKHSDSLDTLILDAVNPSINFEDEEKDGHVLRTLREHSGLRRFEWNSTGMPGYMRSFDAICNLFDGTGWENLSIMSMTGGVEMESETYLESIHIPAAPHLERLLIPCRTAEWATKSKNDWGKAPPPINFIAPSTIKQLRDCPSLHTVQFSVAGHEPTCDSKQWCSHRISGILIRSYTNGIDDFFHLRRLELVKGTPKLYKDYKPMDEECRVPCKNHKWTDHTFYKGYRVLDDTLDKVYKDIKGQGRYWSTPGRDLSMSDKSWRHLQRGLSKATRL